MDSEIESDLDEMLLEGEQDTYTPAPEDIPPPPALTPIPESEPSELDQMLDEGDDDFQPRIEDLVRAKSTADETADSLSFLSNFAISGAEAASPDLQKEQSASALAKPAPIVSQQAMNPEPGALDELLPKAGTDAESKPDLSPQAVGQAPSLPEGGAWRTERLDIEADGKPATVEAGPAVDFLQRRIKSVNQLMECVRAS